MIDTIKKTIEKQKKDGDGSKFGVHINIFGSKGSGKTFAARMITRKCFRKPVVYRMTDDFDKEDVALFKPLNYRSDLDPFIDRMIQAAKKQGVDALIFDEADRMFPANYPLTGTQQELVDQHRHFGLSIVFISRRPQNLNTLVAEEAHFNMFFSIEGDNVIQKLGRVHKEMPQMLASLKYKDYRYIWKELGYPPKICEPLSSR